MKIDTYGKFAVNKVGKTCVKKKKEESLVFCLSDTEASMFTLDQSVFTMGLWTLDSNNICKSLRKNEQLTFREHLNCQ